MKPQLLALFGALATGILLMAGTGTAEAQATRIDFTASQTCTTTSMGEVTFDDEGGMHVRGGTSFCISHTSLPGVLCDVDYLTFNMNLDASGSGRVWGTVRGQWLDGTVVNHGTWQGELASLATMATRVVLQGEGPLEGNLFFADSQAQLTPTGSVTSITGYMLVP